MCDIQKIKDNSTINDMNFTNCDMNKLVIQDKTFTKCKFSKVNLTNAKLKNIKFIEINFEEVKFVSANLENVSFENCVCSQTDYTSAKMKNVSFKNAKLMGSTFMSADMTGVILSDAQLAGANLKAANLENANIAGANLENANLMNANLEKANFTGANLVNAYLAGTNLTGANLTGANLKGANLNGAGLTGAILTDVDLTSTVKPNGVISGVLDISKKDNFKRISYVNYDNFSGLEIKGKTFIACVFTDVKINQTTFTSTTFNNCSFNNINSKKSSFLNCTFNNCNFTFNTMSAASFRSSIFVKVNFQFCYLRDPDFSNVDLRTIIFTGGIFRGIIYDKDESNLKVVSKITVVAIDKIKYTNQGYNPLTKEKENVTQWLKNKDNVVFIVDGKDTPLCVCRDIFDGSVTPMNYIMHACDKKDRTSAKQTIKSKVNTFLDLGMLNLIDGTVTNLHNFTQILKEGQIFSIRKDSGSKLLVYNGELFIKMNDYHNTFKEYSGELFDNITKYFISGITPTEGVLRHISIMDQYFMEHAERTKDNKTVLYRGMNTPYDIATGESMIVHNYLSTTTKMDIVDIFSDELYYTYRANEKPPHLPDDVNNCCAYELTIDKGIPYINMKLSSHSPREEETLLPRNLLITLTGEYINSSKTHIRQLRVSKSTENQFESIPKERCSVYNYANMVVSQIKFVDSFVGRGGSRHRKNKTKKNKTKKIEKW